MWISIFQAMFLWITQQWRPWEKNGWILKTWKNTSYTSNIVKGLSSENCQVFFWRGVEILLSSISSWLASVRSLAISACMTSARSLVYSLVPRVFNLGSSPAERWRLYRLKHTCFLWDSSINAKRPECQYYGHIKEVLVFFFLQLLPFLPFPLFINSLSSGPVMAIQHLAG